VSRRRNDGGEATAVVSGIARNNMLGDGIVAASLPIPNGAGEDDDDGSSGGDGGSWCTCKEVRACFCDTVSYFF
jgi:hypothetical protein